MGRLAAVYRESGAGVNPWETRSLVWRVRFLVVWSVEDEGRWRCTSKIAEGGVSLW